MEHRCPEGWGCVGGVMRWWQGEGVGGCEGMQELRVGSYGRHGDGICRVKERRSEIRGPNGL